MPHSTYLREVSLLREQVPSLAKFPFSIPAIHSLKSIELTSGVTFFLGENGMGKSTLLEGIASAWGFNPEGGSRNLHFATRETHSDLHQYLRLVRGVEKPRDGYFFRAESFYNVASTIEDLDKEPGLSPSITKAYGGKSLHQQSHGESFFSLFLHRFGRNGLYLLDEPEAALSPTRQMSLLVRMHDLVEEGCQFVIATHSPFLLAYPGANLLQFTASGIRPILYEDTDHYKIMRDFSTNRDDLIQLLMRKQDDA